MKSLFFILSLCAIALNLQCSRKESHPAEAHAIPSQAVTLPTLSVPHTAETISLDGHLNEASWKHAARTLPFVNTMQGTPAMPHAISRWLWDDQFLYIAYEVNDRFLKSTYRNQDDHLWEQDAVELMFDPGGDGKNYYELQVSPTGNTFDTQYDSRRQPRPFGHTSWSSEVKVGVSTQGHVNDGSSDRGYTVEMAIPWSAFDLAHGMLATMPFRANMFILDAKKEGGQQACGWSAPLLPDFHIPERFGHITFKPRAHTP